VLKSSGRGEPIQHTRTALLRAYIAALIALAGGIGAAFALAVSGDHLGAQALVKDLENRF
jgi:hypothetical protein